MRNRKAEHRRHYRKNRDKILAYQKKNKERRAIYNEEYYEKNRKKLSANAKTYYLKNKKKISARDKTHYIRNRDTKISYQKEYRKNNKKKIAAKKNIYIKKRIKTDMNFKILMTLRHRIYLALNGNCKSARTAELIGCPIDYFLDYIESQFDDTMSWANHGAWHLDHIIPCVSFDLSKPEEQRRCFHYTNLQPLWAEDNLIKGDKCQCIQR